MKKRIVGAALAVAVCAGTVVPLAAHAAPMRGVVLGAGPQACEAALRGALSGAGLDGVCDRLGTMCGGLFVDADGDGVCDRREEGGAGVGAATGAGAGSCVNDADGDGACDRREDGGVRRAAAGGWHHGGSSSRGGRGAR